jgi:DNA transposition AAA+ family ATPase
MKSLQLVETANVIEVKRLVASYLNRTRSEQRGLALIYGDPGLGKTRMGEQLAFSNGWLYLRLQAKVTAKWFLNEVYQRVTQKVYGAPQIFKGTLAETEAAIIDLLGQNPQIVMVVDEVNLAIQFHKWDILEIVRDFADLSFASFILMGEHDSKAAIERYNKHYFDRCNFFYQFKKNSPADCLKVIKSTTDLIFDDEMLAYIYGKTEGNLRKLSDTLHLMEAYSRRTGKKQLSKADFRGAKTDAE